MISQAAAPSPRPPASPAPNVAASPSPSPTPVARPAEQELVFVRDGNLWLIRLDGTRSVQLTRGGQDREPRWSPDATRVAFIRGSGAAAELYLVSADGRGERRLTHDDLEQRTPRWQPGGDGLAVVEAAAPPVGRPIAPPDASIALLDLASGRSAGLADGFDPAWSPDGAWLAYATNGATVSDTTSPRRNAIRLLNPGSGAEVELLATSGVPSDLEKSHGFPFRPQTGRLRAPSWSADGRLLAVSADGHTGIGLTVDRQSGQVEVLLLNYEGGVGRSAFAPRGVSLAFESRPATGFGHLVLLDQLSGSRVDLGSERQNVSAAEPAWAPDGRRLALIQRGGAQGEPGVRTELVVVGLDGAQQARIAVGNLAQPDWNPLR